MLQAEALPQKQKSQENGKAFATPLTAYRDCTLFQNQDLQAI